MATKTCKYEHCYNVVATIADFNLQSCNQKKTKVWIRCLDQQKHVNMNKYEETRS